MRFATLRRNGGRRFRTSSGSSVGNWSGFLAAEACPNLYPPAKAIPSSAATTKKIPSSCLFPKRISRSLSSLCNISILNCTENLSSPVILVQQGNLLVSSVMQLLTRPFSPAAVLLAFYICHPLSAADTPNLLPGMPPLLDAHNVYSADGPGMISEAIKRFPYRVYVPNSKSDTVDVIDPKTYKIVGHFALPKHSKHLLEPQHVVPSWDLKKLWVAQDLGDQLTMIDPATGKEGPTIQVDDPYNMYFTPDGKYAIVMAEREKRIDFRDAQTMKVVKRVPVNCEGVNHADFTPDGRFMIATCEFSSELIKVDVAAQNCTRPSDSLSPKECRRIAGLSPDGKVFYVANMDSNGVHVIDGNAFRQIEFIKTGKGAHGLYFSRDVKYMYVSNRGEGSVSLIDLATRKWRQSG